MNELGEQIGLFLQENYQQEIMINISEGKKFVLIDFKKVMEKNIFFAEEILDHPEETIKLMEIKIVDLDLPAKPKQFKVRFFNLPKSQQIKIGEVRSQHLSKMISLKGIIRQKSAVRPQANVIRYRCPACDNVIAVMQVEKKIKEPTQCGCGRKGKFKVESKELIDVQLLSLEEAIDELEGTEQAKRINVLLKGDLVSPISEKKTNPGTKIIVSGIVREIPVLLKEGGISTTYDLIFEANYFECCEEEFGELIISEKEEQEIKAIALDNPLQKLCDSLAPTIYGHEKIKKGIILQLVGGVKKMLEDGTKRRGDIHVLLIGDAGVGKSILLKRCQVVAPKSRYVVGTSTSGTGLTACVVKDEILKGWALEGGALVLANKGICMIDELDKMNKDDRDKMHEALEQQSVSVSKANITATLNCETTVLAGANPKFGRFDPYEQVAKQIDLPPTLISRFDLIFTIKDMIDAENDRKLAKFVLSVHRNSVSTHPVIGTSLFRKYLAFAKRNFKPVLSEEVAQKIEDYYCKVRGTGNSEGGVKAMPFTARQLEAIVRLAEAHAKIRLSNAVEFCDVDVGIEIIHHCLEQVGMDLETGKVDVDLVMGGVSATQRNKIVVIKGILDDLKKCYLNGKIPEEEVYRRAEEKGISRFYVEDTMDKLRKAGDVFEPARGFLNVI